MVFAPLRKELGAVTEIFISPDGNLNLLPFEILQGPDNRYLIETYTFNYLAAGRDILGFGAIPEKGGKALLMGDPDFDMSEEEQDAARRQLALTGGEQQRHHEIQGYAGIAFFPVARNPG
jgi:CHAT domain-containing protein